jgi:light-regulated signal transduction histidine kinase (bacteriophytochrome)
VRNKPGVLNDIIEKVASEIRNQMPEKPFSYRLQNWEMFTVIPISYIFCFQCLLDNSVKYCRKDLPLEIKISGEIVSWKNLPENRNVVSNRSYYKVTVADNGMGFDNIFSQKIFKLFNDLIMRKNQ